MSENRPNRTSWFLAAAIVFGGSLILFCLAVVAILIFVNLAPRASGTLPPAVTVEQVPATGIVPSMPASEMPSGAAGEMPTETPAPAASPTGEIPAEESTTFTGGGISLRYPAGLASDLSLEIVPSSEEGAPLQNPEYRKILFHGYPLQGTFHDPQLLIYPAQEYAALEEFAARQIRSLQSLLADPASIQPGELPFLPLWNAAQMMRTAPQPVEFANGSGIRYLTQYGQSFYPINNSELFYTFQGLTTFGEYYIAAIFPVSNPILPDPATIVLDDAFAEAFPQYVEQMQKDLEAQPDDSFSPDLARLDALLRTLEVHPMD